MKDLICIYEIINVVNDKRYIGQTKNFCIRKKRHISNLKNNNHKNDYLQNAWNKYGEINFKFRIIEECSIEDLDSLEIFWINYYDTFNNGYNLCQGGNGQISRELSEYSKHKISLKNKGKLSGNKNPNFNRIYTDLERDLMSKIVKSRKWKGENNPKARQVICLNTNEIFGCIKDAAKKYNIKYTSIIQSCKKQVMAKEKIFMYYNEYKLLDDISINNYMNMVESKKNNKYNNKKKRIKCINTNETFKSMVEASEKYNLDKSSLSKCCLGKIKSCGKDEQGNKLYWCFID